MAHIALPDGVPGIVGPMMAYPETEKHLNGLAEALLRGRSSLTPAEREVIATYVSSQNECFFCMNAHAATARYLLGPDHEVVDHVMISVENAPISAKLKALLIIAGKVQKGGRRVSGEDVARAGRRRR
jgi:AhpD family alkylhydroperoxidase